MRKAVGIPDDWKTDDCLLLSIHRGVYNANIPGHLEAFQAAMADSNSVVTFEQEAILNLTRGGLPAALQKLSALVNEAVCDAQGDPLAIGKTVNCIFYPALDDNGNSPKGPSHSIPMHASDYSGQLEKLKILLQQKLSMEALPPSTPPDQPTLPRAATQSTTPVSRPS